MRRRRFFSTAGLGFAAALVGDPPAGALPQSTQNEFWKNDWIPGDAALDKKEIYLFRRRKAERYVMCRGGHAKATLVELDSGEILAAIGLKHYAEGGFRKSPTPWDTQIGLLRSNDGGKTWSEPQEIISQDWSTDREPSFTKLPNGRLVMTWHGFSKENGQTVANGFISRSFDAGKTWEKPRVLRHPRTGRRMTNGRTNAVAPDGSLLLLVGQQPERGGNFATKGADCYVMRSRDGGASFEEPLLVARHCADSNLVVLPSGKIVCALRMAPVWGAPRPYPTTSDLTGFESLDYMATTASTDGGKTWSELRPTAGYGEVPASLTVLRDGRLLLTYGVRHYPLGVQAKISNDEGKTWDDENQIMLCWFAPIKWNCGHDSYVGHPCTIQRRDGRMVTSYNRWETPLAYSHMEEVVIWDLPAR